MEYDLATSYQNDHELADFVETVTWEYTDADGAPAKVTGLSAKFGDFDTSELLAVASGLAFTNEAAGVVVWQPEPFNTAFTPAENHILRRAGGEGWLIRGGFTKSRFGHWPMACEREVENG